MSHTPAPWEIVYDADRISIEHWESGKVNCLDGIHHVCAFPNAHEEAEWREVQNCEGEIEANAKLIAAAPDLLEASKEVIYWLEKPLPLNKEGTEAMWKLKAAISKATGEPHA